MPESTSSVVEVFIAMFQDMLQSDLQPEALKGDLRPKYQSVIREAVIDLAIKIIEVHARTIKSHLSPEDTVQVLVSLMEFQETLSQTTNPDPQTLAKLQCLSHCINELGSEED